MRTTHIYIYIYIYVVERNQFDCQESSTSALVTLYAYRNLKIKKEPKIEKKNIYTPPGGLEPPTFRLTAERASRLRHGGRYLRYTVC